MKDFSFWFRWRQRAFFCGGEGGGRWWWRWHLVEELGINIAIIITYLVVVRRMLNWTSYFGEATFNNT